MFFTRLAWLRTYPLLYLSKFGFLQFKLPSNSANLSKTPEFGQFPYYGVRVFLNYKLYYSNINLILQWIKL